MDVDPPHVGRDIPHGLHDDARWFLLMLVRLGAEWWAEPMETPADGVTEEYEVDAEVLERWRTARREYLAARAAMVGAIERQGWRAPVMLSGFIDIVFDRPPGPEAPRLLEVEDDHGRSISYGEWVERDDGHWALRIPQTRLVPHDRR